MNEIWQDDLPQQDIPPWEELLLEIEAFTPPPVIQEEGLKAILGLLKGQMNQLAPWLQACESPLEQVTLVAAILVGLKQGFQVKLNPIKNFSQSLFLSPLCSTQANFPLVKITLQAPYLKYRVDFLFQYQQAQIGVECDGGTHFEKHQVARDKKRDRQILQEGGVALMRFTGAEIFGMPFFRLTEVYQYLINQSGYNWHR